MSILSGLILFSEFILTLGYNFCHFLICFQPSSQVKSRCLPTFGGNIIVAGLLLVQDYLPVIEQVLSEGYTPDLIVLPKDSFYFDDLDLTGVSAYTIRDKFGIEIFWC